MISLELLAELKIILKEDYGFDLPPATLLEVATTLLGYFETLAKMEFEGS